MARVRLIEVRKRFGDHAAVDGLTLDVGEGEFLTLLGPSGCGKTTTLRCVAGLEQPSEGEIWIDDDLVASGRRGVFTPPNRRGTGMVFQNYALWPHMTMRGNVGYPLRVAKTDRGAARRRVDELLHLVGLEGMGDRLATELSGGQQQRVALARAVANRPRLLLFDEPLSNLDAKMRVAVRAKIKQLHDATGTTSIYVTHDQEEAIALSDRIVVMNDGRVQQVGTPREVFSSPANLFVADFMGFENVCSGVLVGSERGQVRVRIAESVELQVTTNIAGPLPDDVDVAFRASHVRLAPADAAGAYEYRVAEARYLGNRTELRLEREGLSLIGHLDEAAGQGGRASPVAGDLVHAVVSAHRVVLLSQPRTGPPGTGARNKTLDSSPEVTLSHASTS